MSKLSQEHFDKIDQLTSEMLSFPPSSFTEENILAWAEYFYVAPKDLSTYTTFTGLALHRAVNLARRFQGLKEEALFETPEPIKKDPPGFTFEDFHFLWLKTLLIIGPQSEPDVLNENFSPLFKMALAIETTQQFIRSLANTAKNNGNHTETCERHNALLALLQKIEDAAGNQNIDEVKALYEEARVIFLETAERSAYIELIKNAPSSLRENFLLSQEADVLTENDISEQEEQSLSQKLQQIASGLSISDLDKFDGLDIPFDETQRKAFFTQMSAFLSEFSKEIDSPSASN